MTRAELRELQEAFRLDVVFAGDPDGRPLPCFLALAEERPDGDGLAGRPCSSTREPWRWHACHLISQQQIKNTMWAMGADPDVIELALWDPRMAVCGCDEHHAPFDKHRVALPSEQLVIYREELPEEAIEAMTERGLEMRMEERFPLFSTRCRTACDTPKGP